jgi:hypothetical protein
MDQAVLVFTRRFYSELLANTPVCKAFVDAKNELLANSEIPDSQAEIFKLLKEEDPELKSLNEQNKVSNHVCYSLEIVQQGELVSTSDKHNVTQPSLAPVTLLYRERDMHNSVIGIRDCDSRILAIIGQAGVGRSAVV